jgi:hypothetical protein
MNAGLLPTGPAARRRGVLAFTCAAHLLVLLLWMQDRRIPLPPAPARVVTILLQPDRARTPAPPRAAVAAPPMPHLRPPPPALPAVPVPTPAPDTPASTSPAPAGSPETPTPASASPPGGFTYSLAARQAGRIDRELRNGKPGVPAAADTATARFQRGLESAHVDRSMTIQTDTYTSPDGIVMYRYRTANGVRCRRAGGVGILLQGMPDAPAAMNVDCPKGVEWTRDAP